MFDVDVIVPCFRYGKYLRECIDSILSQRDVRVRVLIVSAERQVERDETDAASSNRCPRTCRVPSFRNMIAFAFKASPQKLSDVGVVINNENLCRQNRISNPFCTVCSTQIQANKIMSPQMRGGHIAKGLQAETLLS
jgi:hypothetical protein